jgi:hypothetical protein
MQRTSSNNIRKSLKARRNAKMSLEIFHDLIDKYAQMTPQNPNQNLDPNQLQVGQQVYSPTGDAMVVVENPMDTTTTTVMPADQATTDVPEGVQTLEESELASQYTLQPNEATPAVTAHSKRAQAIGEDEEMEVDWRDIDDIVKELNKSVQSRDLKGVMASLEELFEMAMQNVNLPEDTEIAEPEGLGSIFAEYIGENK